MLDGRRKISVGHQDTHRQSRWNVRAWSLAYDTFLFPKIGFKGFRVKLNLTPLPGTECATRSRRVVRNRGNYQKEYTRLLAFTMSDLSHSSASRQELAQVLAVLISSTEEIAKLNKDLRWEDQEQYFLSVCPSFIAVVDLCDSRVV